MTRFLSILALVALPTVSYAHGDGSADGDTHDMMSGDHMMMDDAEMGDHAHMGADEDMPAHDDHMMPDEAHADGQMPMTAPEQMPGMQAAGAITEPGQSAFAAIQEIVAHLLADPDTDWNRVDIEALRQHLIDMNNVTLHAKVSESDIEGGARFEATSDDPAVTASIRAMVPAHVATMNGVRGWEMRAEEIPGGSALTVTGADAQKIRALGFIGILTVGAHHQPHHLAMAKGEMTQGH